MIGKLLAQEHSRQILILVLSLVFSVVVPFGLHQSGTTTSREGEFILGGTLFCAFLLIDVMWLTQKVASREHREQELWVLREDCDKELLNVSRCYVRVTRESYGPRDLFVSHFRREIHGLAEQIAEVAERRQLRVQAEHFLNVDNVLDAFQGDDDPIWRYTWGVDNAEPLFDELAWRRYFERTTTMLEAGQIKEARTILIVGDSQGAQSPRVQKLLDFFQTNKGFSCRLVDRADFTELYSGPYIDFGIYGNRLLFLTERYEPNITGLFTKDPAQIQHYCRVFDSMWSSTSVARNKPYRATARVTLEELYEFDEGVSS
jgi:hypothetical protein